ncbi:glycerophosphodiester phosphodiesterase [Paenibacillus sp. GCM10027626]|uniref:glycerophosphodiester phosphodiesterase n=1 Tax=Paenibacillus sp. GCM10027626 TaxID=3273411 RepID=UPI003643E60F
MNEFPLITAHTGCMGTPDNSMASGRVALALGVDIIEDDIRATKDGILVLSHDDEIRTAKGETASLSGMTYRELQEHTETPVAALEELLMLVKGSAAMINLDMKTDEALEPVSRLIRRTDMADRVFMTGCLYERALKAKSVVPELRKLLNVNVQHFRTMAYEEAVSRACKEALDAGCFGLNVPYPVLSGRMKEIAEAAGLLLYVWTVDEAEEMRRCAELGVSSITTRAVDIVQAVKSNWNREIRP